MAKIPAWMKNKWTIIAIFFLIFCTIAILIFLGKQIGYKNLFWDIPLSVIGLMLIAILIAVLTAKGYGKYTYRIGGILAVYLIFHLLWRYFSPTSLKIAAYIPWFWIAEILFLALFALLGKFSLCGWIVNIVTFILIIISVTCIFYYFFVTGGAKKVTLFINNHIERNSFQAFSLKIEETNRETAVRKPLFEKMEQDYQLAKMGKLSPEAEKQNEEGIKTAYPEEAKKEKETRGKEERIISGIFDVPAKSEVVPTGIIYHKGDYIRYEQLQPEISSFWICGEQNNLQVKERTITKIGLMGGEVQLRGGQKPVRVSVRIIR